MMRIITGTARGTKLLSPEGTATRPTSERAKEAVFSILSFDIPGRRVLDLFAGSGQLALEALSRGAESAVLVDSAPGAIDVIRKNVVKTHMEQKASVVRMDCLAYLKSARPDEPFDLIFIDPPYIKRLVPDMLAEILSRELASRRAIFVCESEEEDLFEGNETLREQFIVRRTARYAKAVVTILERNHQEAEE
jgi:16S rRNA (guanine(966)-N(2))-methyltransferase RsmD